MSKANKNLIPEGAVIIWHFTIKSAVYQNKSTILLVQTCPNYPKLTNLGLFILFTPPAQAVRVMETKAKITDKGLLQTPELYQYILDTSVHPREPEPLKELRAITSNHPLALMGTAADAGQFMALLLKIINAKKTIEIGVFTGYSLLLTALTIPDDGKIIAIDLDRSAYEIGLPIIEKAGVKHKINFVESRALPILDQLLQDSDNKETFDFAFVDADKINYANYHEKLLQLLKPGGIAVYDNTLWGGSVAMPEDSTPDNRHATRSASIEFNKYLAADSRVQISLVPLGDGITICRRLL